MMTDNTEHQLDELESGLLRAGRDVQMSPEARDKTLAALGLGAVGVTTAATSKAAAASSFSTKGLALWAVGGAGAIGIVVVAAMGVTSLQGPHGEPEAPEITASATSSQAIGPSQVESASAVVAQADPPLAAEVDESLPAEKPETDEPGAVTPGSEKPKPSLSQRSSASSLAKELQHIALVETALGSGQSGRALSLLSEYRKAFPRPQLGLEAEVLTIQALAQSGNHAQASRRAERFVQHHPASPLATRARKYTLQDVPR